MYAGAACSFSECAITIVAYRSTITPAPAGTGQRRAQSPPARPRGLPQGPQCGVDLAGKGVDQPGHGRIRGHRPEQPGLGGQGAGIGEAVSTRATLVATSSTTLSRSCTARGLASRLQLGRERSVQAHRAVRLDQRHRPGLGHQPRAGSTPGVLQSREWPV